jgi:hypothetical protein
MDISWTHVTPRAAASAAAVVVEWVEAVAKAETAERVPHITAPQYGAPFFCALLLARAAQGE